MIEDDPIADLIGQASVTRSAREVAEDRLHCWLEQGWPDAHYRRGWQPWSGACNPMGPLPWPESVCILAGLDPEVSASADTDGWTLLPGALALYGFDIFPRDRHGLHVLHTLAEARIQRLRGLHLKTMSAKDAIKAAVDANLSPPWLAAYLDSDHAKRMLKNYERADLRARLRDEAAEPGTNPQSDKAYAKLYGQFPNWDEDLRKIAWLTGEGMPVREITKRLGRDVRHLVAKLRKAGTAEAIMTAAEEETAGFRDWKERAGKA